MGNRQENQAFRLGAQRKSAFCRPASQEGNRKICLIKKKKKLAFFKDIRYNNVRCPGVAQLVARLTGGQEAVSSSLATRTKIEQTAKCGLLCFLFKHLS